MTTAVNSIEIPREFVTLCGQWHNGQSSILYAIASTGNLTLGTARPTDCETDEKWYLHLWQNLEVELARLVRQVSNRNPDNEDLASLDRFQKFAERTAERLQTEYETED